MVYSRLAVPIDLLILHEINLAVLLLAEGLSSDLIKICVSVRGGFMRPKKVYFDVIFLQNEATDDYPGT